MSKGAARQAGCATLDQAGARMSPFSHNEAIMNMQFLRRGVTARSATHLKARSSLVRRLIQARDDPGKHRIRGWLRNLSDEQLSRLGLTFEDIAVLRGTQTPSSSQPEGGHGEGN